jgi:hypothetical protein
LAQAALAQAAACGQERKSKREIIMWTGSDAQTTQPRLLGGSCSSLARENKVGAAERDAKRDWVAERKEERGKDDMIWTLMMDLAPH